MDTDTQEKAKIMRREYIVSLKPFLKGENFYDT